MTTTTNGRARKSLAEQIDRLDAILDGLAENLNAAVADAVAGAVKEAVTVAVQEAVHAAVLEVLTNAELRRRLAVPQTPAIRPSAPVVVCLAGAVRRCWGWLTGVARDAWDAAKAVARLAGGRAVEAVHRVAADARAKADEVREQVAAKARVCWLLALALAALARRFRKQLLVAVLVGVLVGVAFYLGGREVASLGCAAAGFAGSLATGAVNRLRRMLRLSPGGAS
jgi:hypothetical protein